MLRPPPGLRVRRYLDQDEIAAMCKRMGLKLSTKGIEKAMAAMDDDGDGTALP